MKKRFLSIYFRYLQTDWFTRRQPHLGDLPVVLATAEHGRMVVTAANQLAERQGAQAGMVVADARAMIPAIVVLDHIPELPARLLNGIAKWCIRYAPSVAIDLPSGVILDSSGCAHLWGGENEYLEHIIKRLTNFGYHVNAAIAGTVGTAWAVARYTEGTVIVPPGQETAALLPLPAAALRLDAEIVQRLLKLGLSRVRDFISFPRTAVRRRFGRHMLLRMDQATGNEDEVMQWVHSPLPYQQRLPCLEPVITAQGIAIALQRLLHELCGRLQLEEKGLRTACLTCYRVDGITQKICIETIRPSCNRRHLFKLFEHKLTAVEPALGIELFMLEAPVVEVAAPLQEKLWTTHGAMDDIALWELLDRLAGKIGADNIRRYLPDQHYWPERSFRPATDLHANASMEWKSDRPRPLHLLSMPEAIEVTAPIPDYPPMLFRYQGLLHKIVKADGPERIEQEWWIQHGQHRDYYCVEDEKGCRYWLFRSGHYDTSKTYKWFIHGFFP